MRVLANWSFWQEARAQLVAGAQWVASFVASSTALWVGAIALTLIVITLQLMTQPRTALEYWYLMSVPIILGGFRFGRTGALVTSALSAVVLLVIFRTAGHGFQQVVGFFGTLMEATTSPEELRRLAFQLGDLQASNPEVSFQRAITGLILVIIGGTLLGGAVDNRNRAYLVLEQTLRRLRQYFSPQLIQYLTSYESSAGTVTVSARREITILFADLRDFTALSERMEPEEIVTLLNEYLGAMTEEIFREDGTLDKYIGDGLMAFFGDPVWYPDHSLRAVRAALTMQRRMRELHRTWMARGWSTIGMGIGLTSGLVTVGNVGSPTRMEYTAIGSTVNIAARLSADAREGQILTTRRTYRLVQHLVGAIEREPTMVKGFTQPIDIVEITGTRLAPYEGADGAGPRLNQVVSSVASDASYRAFVLSNPTEASTMYGLAPGEESLVRQMAVLCGYPVFSGLPPEEIANLMAAAAVEDHLEGAVIVRPGGLEDKFYIILLGDVAVTASDEGDREVHIASLARGEYFGEIAVLYDTGRTATVRTTSPCRLLVLHKANFESVLERAPTLRGRIEATAKTRMIRPFSPSAPLA